MASSVSIVGDGTRIRKTTDDPALCRTEVERTTDATALASRLGTFAVPEIIERTETSITFDRYHPSVTISQLLAVDYPKALSLTAEVAALIVAIQTGLTHNVGLELPIEELRFGHRATFVHGDFTPDNLLFDDEQLIVIDWCSSHWVREQFNRAPDHWDLIWYIQCVYVRDFGGTLSRANRDAYCREIVAHYKRLRPDLDLADLAEHAISMNRYFQHQVFAPSRPLRSRLRHSHRWVAFRRFWHSYRS